MTKLSKNCGILLMILALVAAPSLVSAAEEAKRDIGITIWEPTNLNLDKTIMETLDAVDTQGGGFPSYWSQRYRIALFLALNPRVKINWEETKKWPNYMWSEKEPLLVGLAAGEAPCFYAAGLLGGHIVTDIKEGFAADITDLVKDWKWTDYLKENWWPYWEQGWYEGRCYGLLHMAGVNPGDTFVYRKDKFEEAGIFNEEGNPGPPINWTTDDFLNICKKLTNPKEKFWALPVEFEFTRVINRMMDSFGIPTVIPDKTGEYTWKCGLNLPESMPLLEWVRDLSKSGCIHVFPLTAIGGERNVREMFPTGRYAMGFFRGLTASVGRAVQSLSNPSVFRIEGVDAPFCEVGGIAPIPMGPQGVRTSGADVTGSLYVFNPTLDKEHLKAAFDFFNFYQNGPGLDIVWEMDRIMTGAEKYVQTRFMPYPVKGDVVRFEDTVPEFKKVADVILKFLSQPRPEGYNLEVNLGGDFKWTTLSAFPLFDTILSNPDVDLQKLADREVDRINKGQLDYKLEGQTVQNYKEYYTALGAFYEKNFPEYYEKTFKTLLEKYYRVW